MTECQNDLRPKEKDGLETAEIVRLVPLEGSEVGHSIVKNCKDFYYITLLHWHKPFFMVLTETKMQYLSTQVRQNLGFHKPQNDSAALEEGMTIKSLSSPCDFCSEIVHMNVLYPVTVLPRAT